MQKSMACQNEIHKMSTSKLLEDRMEALELLKITFKELPNKEMAWLDLYNLAKENFGEPNPETQNMRLEATLALGTVFALTPDKDRAWKDLFYLAQDRNFDELAQDRNYGVRWAATDCLGIAFPYVKGKIQAWQDLFDLAQDEHLLVAKNAAYALQKVFPDMPDKTKALNDIIILTGDRDRDVRRIASGILINAYPYITDKRELWQNLLNIAKSSDDVVKKRAIEALGMAFVDMPDKEKAFQDIHWLVKSTRENIVGRSLARILGYIYSYAQDRSLIWEDLIYLAKCPMLEIKIYANHSLGRISILKAAESWDKECLVREMKAAIAYFEVSSSMQSVFNPADFCLPFYRTYLAVAFLEAEEDDIQKYLSEAKKAVGSSEGKDELLKAVENLAKALRESQHLKDRPLEEIASELNAYRWYCDKAADYMAAAEDKAPGAVKLMRKCNPFLEERIQATISEIQKAAKQICQTTHGSGTAYEAPGAEINKAAKALSSGDITSMHKCSNRIVGLLKKFCKLLPEEEKGPVCEVVTEIEHGVELPRRLERIEAALLYLSPVLESHRQSSAEQEKILGLLKNIEFAISNLSINSGNANASLFQNLSSIRSSIESLQDSIKGQGQDITQLDITLKEMDQAEIERLEKMRKDLLRLVERSIIQSRSTDKKAQEILDKIKGMEQPKIRDGVSILADIIQIGSFLSFCLPS